MDLDVIKSIAEFWVDNGGTVKEFERSWPSIKTQIKILKDSKKNKFDCEECGSNGFVTSYEGGRKVLVQCNTCG